MLNFLEQDILRLVDTFFFRFLFLSINDQFFSIDTSPLPNRQDTCGWNVAISFILSPSFEPDTSCLKNISPLDFAGIMTRTQEMALHHFGTDNVRDMDRVINTSANNIPLKFECIFLMLIFIVAR